MASFQGFYRRGQKYTAVRHIRLSSSVVLEPGTEIPSEKLPMKEFHLRSLFSRRRIGVTDSPWTKKMLEGLNNTRSLPELEKVTDPETPDPEELEKVDDPEIINPVDIVVKEGVEKSGLEKVTETNGGTNTPPWVQK